VKKILHIAFLLLIGFSTQAQVSNLKKALIAIKSGDYPTARVFLDSAASHPETQEMLETWYYRGYTYRELYKAQEKNNPNSPLREKAVESYKRFFELDTMSEFRSSAEKTLNALAVSYYNDAVVNLTADNYPVAIKNFEKYKATVRIFDPNRTFTDVEKQFHKALASLFAQMYESDRKNNEPYFQKAIDEYSLVLSLDSNDYSANYNLAILYYNEAVNIIKETEYEVDLLTLDLIQEKTVDLFKKALPYMQKAYQLNPNKKEPLIGLVGIYYSLNEIDKYEELNQKLEKMKTQE
jgi:tetratricopeptide (TPR) repeat protein